MKRLYLVDVNDGTELELEVFTDDIPGNELVTVAVLICLREDMFALSRTLKTIQVLALI